MSTEDLERYETEIERKALIVNTETCSRCSSTSWKRSGASTSPTKWISTCAERDGDTYFELKLRDAWVWDMYRNTRFVADVRVVTFKDVNVEELPGKDL